MSGALKECDGTDYATCTADLVTDITEALRVCDLTCAEKVEEQYQSDLDDCAGDASCEADAAEERDNKLEYCVCKEAAEVECADETWQKWCIWRSVRECLESE